MVTEKIRFATIGTNFIVKRFLEAAQQCDWFCYQAAYSRNRETAQKFLGADTSVRIYDRLAELAQATDIDAVYLASPTCCHAAQAVEMMRQGKHVLCEKPIASNYEEWAWMKQTAQEHHVVLMEAMRPLYTPGFLKIKQQLPQLGKIRRVNLNYCQYSSRYDKFKAGIVENAFRPELSNGALMDIGVYCVEVLLGLFGKPKNILAQGYILKDSIDGQGTILASYEEMQAVMQYAKITDSLLDSEIQGEEGTLTFSNIGSPNHIRIAYRDGRQVELEDTNSPFDMIHELSYFIDAISNRDRLTKCHAISAQSMQILDEARRQIGIHFPADERNSG